MENTVEVFKYTEVTAFAPPEDDPIRSLSLHEAFVDKQPYEVIEVLCERLLRLEIEIEKLRGEFHANRS